MSQSSQTILLVDVSPLAYSTYNKVGHLKTSTGISTGLRYGVIRSLRSWTNRCKATRTVVVYDSPSATQTRRDEHELPEYKANRPWTDEKENMYSQFGDLKDMLELTNYMQIESEGFEADEIICNLAKSQSEKGHRVFIASPDHDLLQAVNDEKKVMGFFHKEKGNSAFIHEERVRELTGVWPRHLAYMKAVIGDTSDNISGVLKGKGRADELAKSFTVHDPQTLSDAVDCVTQLNSLSTAQLDAIQANFNIVHPRTPSGLDIRPGQKDEEKLTKLFEELEFKSVMRFIPEWTT